VTDRPLRVLPLLHEAERRAREVAQLLPVVHDGGYEPSRGEVGPKVSGSPGGTRDPRGGELEARSAFRFAAREVARAAVRLSREGLCAHEPVDGRVADGRVTPSLADALGAAERMRAGFVNAAARLGREGGATPLEVLRAVGHEDRAVRCLSPFRPVGGGPVTHDPARRRRDLEASS
jgi:hypothetical protein